MATLTTVPVGSLPFERFETVLDGSEYGRLLDAVVRGRELLAGRVIWNVNSTARGGGVAELLSSVLAYARGAGVDVRWEVIAGNPEFFAITKRIHNWLHGAPGDGGPLGAEERDVYEATLDANARDLCEVVGDGDVVILHDPQTAGMVTALKARHIRVIWRCHVGLDTPNEHARRAWQFLLPYVRQADRYVFSRRAFAWPQLEAERIAVIAPVIDVYSPKNQELAPPVVDAILARAGIQAGGDHGEAVFIREDGSPGRVDRHATVYQERPVGRDEAMVLQVSRWDRLKDPLGVIQGFARHVAPRTGAHLIYAGPAVEAVSDDPEGRAVLDEAFDAWRRLSPPVRERVHLACLPMDDPEENGAMVNALQRRADVVVQKSLAEGFGLTVAEAMWKARPVVASRVGGIQEQISGPECGVLLDDPHDLAAFGAAVEERLVDVEGSARMGAAARERVRAHFLDTRSLFDYLDLVASLIPRPCAS